MELYCASLLSYVSSYITELPELRFIFCSKIKKKEKVEW